MAGLYRYTPTKGYLKEKYFRNEPQVINIGSNNTTIFNGCGDFCGGWNGSWGCFKGGFGRGIGYGIGYGIMSMLMGGVYNTGYPTLGANLFANLWGTKKSDNNGAATLSTTCTCNCCNGNDNSDDVKATPTLNKDRTNIDTLTAERLKLGDNPTAEDKAKFNKKIDDAIAAQTAETTEIDAQDKKELEGLKYQSPQVGLGNDNPVDKKPVNDDSVVDNAKDIENAENLDDLKKVPYDKLSEDDKKAYVDKAYDLLNADKISADDLSKLPEDARKAIKTKFYGNFTNVTSDELNNLTPEQLKNLMKDVIDSSEIADFINKEWSTPTFNSTTKKWTIPMKHNYTDSEGNAKTVVNYVQIDPEDGEILFHGLKDDQVYVLQKDKTNNRYTLNQYKYHKGWNSADVNG